MDSNLFFILDYQGLACPGPPAGDDYGRSIQIGVRYVPLQQHYL